MTDALRDTRDALAWELAVLDQRIAAHDPLDRRGLTVLQDVHGWLMAAGRALDVELTARRIERPRRLEVV